MYILFEMHRVMYIRIYAHAHGVHCRNPTGIGRHIIIISYNVCIIETGSKQTPLASTSRGQPRNASERTEHNIVYGVIFLPARSDVDAIIIIISLYVLYTHIGLADRLRLCFYTILLSYWFT